MSRNHRRKVEEIFQDLLDLPVEERAAALENRCGHDETLRQEVTDLLEHYKAARPEFLEEPVFARGADDDELPVSVGPYAVLGRLGDGGMGVIYEAQQEHPRRRIAVKVLRAGLHSRSQLSRFRAEWDALGRLNHPGIANVYEAGMGEVVFAERSNIELPYLAMELVRGHDLIEHVEHAELDRESRLHLFAGVCDAIHYAHEQSVIHRDLKPSNIVVDASGRPKILDFGVARITDQERTKNTRTGDVIGTVRYMSPEQLFGNRDVDARTDVYSLGVILYELLTGESPYGESDTSITDRILWHERGSVPRIAQHDHTLKGDIDAIVRMAMATGPAERYQSVADLADDIRRHLQGEPVLAPAETRRDAWKRFARRRRAAIAGAVVIVGVASAIAMQLVNPFGGRSLLAQRIAAGDRLAVMYFDNVSQPDDPGHRGEIVTELLISGLSQSERLNVVSSQRLYDALKLMGKEGEKKIDRATATEVATHASARWMMLGRILQSEPNLVVTSQIVDVKTGDVAASQLTKGNAGESLFSLVDRITARTLDDLAVPESGTSPRPVAEMSTASEEAYRYYLDGVEYGRKWFSQEARESFTKALEIDSTFAMAAFRLGMLENDNSERRRHFQQALRHADRASPREKLYLKAAEALAERQGAKAIPVWKAVLERYPDDKFALGKLAFGSQNPEERLEYSNRLLELDPTNTLALISLALAHSERGDLENALRALDRHTELTPGEADPYDTRGTIYAQFGRLDDAISSLEKAIEIKPGLGDYGSVIKLGNAYANKGDYDKAEALYRRLFESSDAWIRARGRSMLIRLFRYRGRCRQALEEIEVAQAVDRMEGLTESANGRINSKAKILFDIGEAAQALEAYEEWIKSALVDDFWSRVGEAYLLARMGKGDAAEECLAPLRAGRDSLTAHESLVLELHTARVAAARGDHDEAVTHFRTLWEKWPYGRMSPWSFRFLYDFAEVCHDAGRWDDVIHVVEEALTGYPFAADNGIRDARFHYFLGVAYQEVGRTDDAIEQLEKLLTIWANADPGLVGLEDARTRLAALNQGG